MESNQVISHFPKVKMYQTKGKGQLFLVSYSKKLLGHKMFILSSPEACVNTTTTTERAQEGPFFSVVASLFKNLPM